MTCNSRSRHRALGLVALLAIGNACHENDDAARDELLRRSDAARLAGEWNVRLVLEHPLSQLYDASVTVGPIVGTIAFTENRTSAQELADFGTVTHKGVYDLDLGAFRLPAANDARGQSAVARTVPVPSDRSAPDADSVIVALVPGGTRLRLRLTGLLAGDTITGWWTAEFLRTAASGRFVMARRRESP